MIENERNITQKIKMYNVRMKKQSKQISSKPGHLFFQHVFHINSLLYKPFVHTKADNSNNNYKVLITLIL